MHYPDIKMVPTKDLLQEVYDRTALCLMFIIEKEEDIQSNTNTFVAKGSPSLLGAISGALVYDATVMIYESTNEKDACRLYLDNYVSNYNDSVKLIYEQEFV